jgi:hypothetical protein
MTKPPVAIAAGGFVTSEELLNEKFSLNISPDVNLQRPAGRYRWGVYIGQIKRQDNVSRCYRGRCGRFGRDDPPGPEDGLAPDPGAAGG